MSGCSSLLCNNTVNGRYDISEWPGRYHAGENYDAMLGALAALTCLLFATSLVRFDLFAMATLSFELFVLLGFHQSIAIAFNSPRPGPAIAFLLPPRDQLGNFGVHQCLGPWGHMQQGLRNSEKPYMPSCEKQTIKRRDEQARTLLPLVHE